MSAADLSFQTYIWRKDDFEHGLKLSGVFGDVFVVAMRKRHCDPDGFTCWPLSQIDYREGREDKPSLLECQAEFARPQSSLVADFSPQTG